MLKPGDEREGTAATPVGGWRQWARLLRVHQWSKNVLVFVPMLTAHRFELGALLTAATAFLAFSLIASAFYIVNDAVDLEADRAHRSKRFRPLAAGTVSLRTALAAVPVLVAAAFALAATTTLAFVGVLALYGITTVAYTFLFKRLMLLDVIVLALLYALRVVGGAAALGITISEWLLIFSVFVFASLALVKRYSELAARFDAGLADPMNRDYRTSDLSVVAALAGASGLNAVTVFALYVSSPAVTALYAHPQRLWLICPVLMYWLTRTLMLAHRREMDDDPVVFALRDKVSLASFLLIAAIALSAL
jgi:4-hydroxybenzoate polyprenyltransferase